MTLDAVTTPNAFNDVILQTRRVHSAYSQEDYHDRVDTVQAGIMGCVVDVLVIYTCLRMPL